MLPPPSVHLHPLQKMDGLWSLAALLEFSQSRGVWGAQDLPETESSQSWLLAQA